MTEYIDSFYTYVTANIDRYKLIRKKNRKIEPKLKEIKAYLSELKKENNEMKIKIEKLEKLRIKLQTQKSELLIKADKYEKTVNLIDMFSDFFIRKFHDSNIVLGFYFYYLIEIKNLKKKDAASLINKLIVTSKHEQTYFNYLKKFKSVCFGNL